MFIVFGIMAGRAVARELCRVSTSRAGVAAGSAIRLICLILTYLTVGLGLLALLQVDLGNLFVGGAVTGIVIGIAAQQTLGNFFAGLVLFFARPYVPGQRVKVHSGGLGGPFIGVIVGAGLLYTFIETKAGVVSLPNAGLLASAIGPPDDGGRRGRRSCGRVRRDGRAGRGSGRSGDPRPALSLCSPKARSWRRGGFRPEELRRARDHSGELALLRRVTASMAG